METRAKTIRQLQKEITAIEATMAKFGNSPALQVLLDRKKEQLEYEKQVELQEVNRPLIVKPSPKSWQDNITLYIIITIAILVIAGIFVFLITNNFLSFSR